VPQLASVETTPLYSLARFTDVDSLNQDLLSGFSAAQNAPDTRKDHFFAGRYENIYVSSTQCPALKILRQHILACATDLLGKPQSVLRYGAWFNAMQPGDVTEAHHHDDFDEVISAVYYIQCAPQCGDLILLPDGDAAVHIEPQVGNTVFFSPALEHAVAQNRSQQLRLSVGINIGMSLNDDPDS